MLNGADSRHTTHAYLQCTLYCIVDIKGDAISKETLFYWG
jgi:hypothetical protein